MTVDVLGEVQAVAAHVLGTAGPSILGVRSGRRGGSGVILSPGRVATNAHNVRAGMTTIAFSDGREAEGTVLGVDIASDLAVVDVDTGEAPPLEWAAAPPAAGGAIVFALANPGARGLRVSWGMVSAVGQAFRGPSGRRITGGVEHTAPLPPGSSGGPIVDATGRILGLNTHRLGDGFYLALPATADLRQRLLELSTGRSRVPRRLGVGVAPPRMAHALREAVGLEPRDGLLVRLVEDDSPAARAGLRVGDLLTAAAGQALGSTDDLHGILDAADAAVELTVLRGTEELAVAVAFEDDS